MKSDVMVIGKIENRKRLFGIDIRKSAKYLGVTYDKFLKVSRAQKVMEPKINWVFSRLYHLLRKSSFRVRYNLWQTFVAPLHVMTLSLIGEPNSYRAL